MINFVIILNILLILAVFAGQFLTKIKASPKIIAIVITLACSALGFYSLLLILLGLKFLFAMKFIYTIVLFIFAIAPFVIGTVSTYQKAEFYIGLQQLIYVLSLIALFKIKY